MTEAFSAEQITDKLYTMLPELGTEIIEDHLDMSDPRNVSFAEHPDDPAEHSPRWHQFGIITHSYEFARSMREDIPRLIGAWGLADTVDSSLDDAIDGVTKRDLLQVVSMVHDTGKFAARRWQADKDTGIELARFQQHEVFSGDIVRGELEPVLLGEGLTEGQIGYIATCAELHFELGKARGASKETTGYTLAFADSPEFQAAALDIINAHPGYAMEIGLMFIADSISKTDVAATATSDEEIAAQRPALEAEIAARGLDPMLINQALQQPVNLKIARSYLTIWSDTARP